MKKQTTGRSMLSNRYLAGCLVAAALLAASGRIYADPLRIAYTSIAVVYGPLWLTKEAGLFKKYGIEPEFIYIAGGPPSLQALLAGDVSIAFTAGGALAVLEKYTKQKTNAAIEKVYEVYATKYFKRAPEATPTAIQTILEEISASRPLPPGIKPERFTESRFIRELVSSGFIDRLYKGR